jgi:preprotein translocase subunit SecD
MRKTTRIVLICLGAWFALWLGVFLLFGPVKERLGALYFKLGSKPKTELILQVQVQDAVKEEADLVVGRLPYELQRMQIAYAAIDRNDPSTIEQTDSIQIDLKGIPAARMGDLRSLAGDRFPGWVLTPVNTTDYQMNLRPSELFAAKRAAVEQAVSTIRNRLRGLGLMGRVFPRAGGGSDGYEIVVQLLEAVDDPARIREILTTRAQLEISEVIDGPFPNRDQALAKHGGVLPLASKLAQGVPRRGEGGELWYLLSRTPVITGRDLRDASPSKNEMGRWETGFTLTKESAQRFGRFTESHIGSRLAIALDNQVWSAPVIQSRIEDSGRITGSVSEREASDLALVLRSGSLPARVFVIQER